MTRYTIEIDVDDNLVNDAARQMLPGLIKRFGQHVTAKLSLVTSTQSFELSASLYEGNDFRGKDIDLTSPLEEQVEN